MITVKAVDTNVKASVQKVNLVASLIRGLAVEKARCQLIFSHKKVARCVSKVLMSSVANAQNNFSLDIDNLYVKDVLVGKGMTLKRFSPRARGRATKVKKHYSQVTVLLGVLQ